jgi:hypothetical protein
MTNSNIVNSVGLILDIVGAGLLWRFGLPADISRSGAILLATEQIDEEERRKALRYDQVAFWGFLLLVGGFALQLVSNFLTS